MGIPYRAESARPPVRACITGCPNGYEKHEKKIKISWLLFLQRLFLLSHRRLVPDRLKEGAEQNTIEEVNSIKDREAQDEKR